MAKAYDVPAEDLIERLTEHIKKEKKIQPPNWAGFVKTGAHTQRIPYNKDWWYTRCASLIRKVYIHGPIGVSDLRSEYGGKKKLGYNLAHHRDAGGAIIRKALQQLQQAGYIVNKSKGRSISEEGMKKVDRIATELYDEIIKSSPQLQRYA
ncbi:MAG: 30S ribosomal protein S19e [Nitrososphaeraceae archaeon]